MEFSIYSYGNADIVWKVLNTVVLIFNADLFTKMIVVIGGIAALAVGAKAIASASILNFLREYLLPILFIGGMFWGPKAKINLIDEVDPNFKYSVVDNVPLGVAFGASLSSNLGKALTKLIEDNLADSDSHRFSKVGSMFAARALYEANTLTIADPIMKNNIKDFMRQCYMWPFIFSNIAPGKKAAMETDDVLGFIKQNAHQSLGMYWRDPLGNSSFMFCNECAVKVAEVLPLEVESGLSFLGNSLLGNTSKDQSDQQTQTNRLKQYLGNAFSVISNGTANSSKIVEQELLLNTYRAALDDKRAEAGLGRNPLMAYVNAERGQAQQNEGFFVKAAMASAQLPWLHGVILAFSLMFFGIMAPFTFMKGGMSLIKFYFQINLWLATWPAFFAIFNGLGHLYLAKSQGSYLMQTGGGLNLLTQNGLASSAFNTYAFMMGAQLSIPFLSWVFISKGSGYAMSQLSSYLTQGGEAYAGRVGAEQVDGNVSFDSQTLHHRSVANASIAQQTLGPNINYGSRIDDGSLATTYGSLRDDGDRRATTHQHVTQLGTNYTATDAFSQVYAHAATTAHMTGLQHSQSAAESVNKGMSSLYQLTNSISRNKNFNETFGKTDSAGSSQSLNQSLDKIAKISKDIGVSAETGFGLAIGASVNASVGGDKGKGKGLLGSLGLNFNGSGTASARDTEAFNQHWGKGDSEALVKGVQESVSYARGEQGSLGDSSLHSELGQVTDNFSKASQYNSQAQAYFTTSQSWNDSATSSRSNSTSAQTNLNDPVLQKIADDNYRGNLATATEQATKNPGAMENFGREEINDYQGRGNQPSRSTVEQTYKDEYLPQIASAPTASQEVDNGVGSIAGQDEDLGSRLDNLQHENKQGMDNINQRIKQNDLQQRGNEMEQEYAHEKNKGSAKRTFQKIGKK